MIHNITEEREKRYQQDVSPAAALTDEELLRLIEQVEERELLHAPIHLKEETFQRIDRDRKRERGRRLIFYRVQVLAGMAAALMVLLLIPVEGPNMPGRELAAFTDRILWEDGTADMDEWERTVLEREKEIDRAWQRYQRKQERKDAGERYLREMKHYFTNNFEWED